MASNEPPQKRIKAEDTEQKEWGLKDMLDCTVSIVTNDGRHIVGTLKGFDKVQNIILTNSLERIYCKEAAAEMVPLGLYVVRGDSIAVIGEVDEERDDEVDWDSISVEPMRIISHS